MPTKPGGECVPRDTTKVGDTFRGTVVVPREGQKAEVYSLEGTRRVTNPTKVCLFDALRNGINAGRACKQCGADFNKVTPTPLRPRTP